MPAPVTIDLPTEADADRFAAALARRAGPGDTILLSGPIGAGKTHFARAFIRARLGDPAAEVPSPTFTLVQTYPHAAGDIWHCDLYRLTDPGEVVELGLDEAFGVAICLVEWPDRLGRDAPPGALRLDFAMAQEGGRVTIRGDAGWTARLEAALA